VVVAVDALPTGDDRDEVIGDRARTSALERQFGSFEPAASVA
jgi:hypothetical protein